MDNKAKRSNADRSKVAANEDYEVQTLAKKLGVSPAQVRAAIKRVGTKRLKIVETLGK